MDEISKKRDEEILKLQDHLSNLDPTSVEYARVNAQLCRLLDARDKDVRTQIDADDREKKREQRDKTISKRNKTELGKAAIAVGGSTILTGLAMKAEYIDFKVLNNRIMKWIPNIRFPF